MAEPQILDPAVARRVFEAAVARIGGDTFQIPGNPPVDWRIAGSAFPLLRVELLVAKTKGIVLVLDCTNFDFDPPTLHFEDRAGRPIAWGAVKQLVAPYSGIVRGEFHDDINDVILYPNGVGLVCRRGNEAFHEVHPEVNWRELRPSNEGRLEFIIDSSIRLLDARKLALLQ